MTTEQRPLLTTDLDTKDVTLSAMMLEDAPTLRTAHHDADELYKNDPEARLRKLSDAQFSFKLNGGPAVQASLEVPETGKLDEVLVMFAPFSDCAPATSSETMMQYLEGSKHNWAAKELGAKPHTWNQATKSAVTHDLLEAAGVPMPVLTIYSPIPPKSYERHERKAIRHGDFHPADQLVHAAMRIAQEEIHGFSGTTRITDWHFDGASLGAHNAIGAANRLANDQPPKTVTARELILGIGNIAQLAKRFTVSPIVGEAGPDIIDPRGRIIGESAMRRAIDAHGSEPLGMQARMLRGMSKLGYMNGLTRSEPTIQALRELTESGSSVLVTSANNSSLSEFTSQLLPDGVEHATVAAEKGKQLGHIMNEHVVLSASIVAYHILKSRTL